MDKDDRLNAWTNIIYLVMLLVTVVYSTPPLRYRLNKLLAHAWYEIRLVLYDLRHIPDPAWKRELADRTDAFILLPAGKPRWWIKLDEEVSVSETE